MKTITVIGGDLYRIALQELGSAEQWVRIAKINNRVDPVLTGIVTLTIPPVDANAGGGIYGA